jgi:hypothetical protein
MTRRKTTLVVLLVACAAVLAGCAHGGATPAAAARTQTAGIGDWPTFLPTPSDAGRSHGSAADPAMSYAGSPVVITLDQGTVTANVQGPTFPAGTKLGATQVACTFAVVLSDASRAVALDTARFDVLDHQGTAHALQPASGQTLPATVQPGQTVTLDLVATVPAGEGQLRYAPDGTHTAAAWDYVVETD